MDSPSILYALRWLIYDTFRQALASRLFWVMIAISGLCIFFCLSISFEGGRLEKDGDFIFEEGAKDPVSGGLQKPGRMNLLFGMQRVILHRDVPAEVRMLGVMFGTWVAGGAGLLFTLVWTAGFIPEFLHPSTAAVLLAKPIPRWLFLLGKYLGVVAFVALQAIIFFVGTWAALGLRSGVWLEGYLAGIPLFVLHFAIFYSFSVLLGVWTRNTIPCVLGSVLFWVLCFALNYGRHALMTLDKLSPTTPTPSGITKLFTEVGYWMLPKPADLLVSMEKAIGAVDEKATLASLPEFEAAWNAGLIDPILGSLAGVGFIFAMLFIAGRQLRDTDY